MFGRPVFSTSDVIGFSGVGESGGLAVGNAALRVWLLSWTRGME